MRLAFMEANIGLPERIAIVIGATGLVGTALVEQLLNNREYIKVKTFVRRRSGTPHPRLEEHIVDFDRIDKFKDQISGDVLFSAMGTTIKRAGSQDAQYKVDFTYQYEIARAAAQNGVPEYVLISSAGANSKAVFFYPRMKGELEESVIQLPFKHINILRPSFLDGQRKEKRTLEKVGITASRIVSALPGLNKFQPIYAETVARSMQAAAKVQDKKKALIFENTDLFELAKMR
jgi:uncharacterized protein YbjT (DUF2867 family)